MKLRHDITHGFHVMHADNDATEFVPAPANTESAQTVHFFLRHTKSDAFFSHARGRAASCLKTLRSPHLSEPLCISTIFQWNGISRHKGVAPRTNFAAGQLGKAKE
jgi:hypothetical protein